MLLICKKAFLLLWKFLIYLVCVPKFKSINSSSLFRKNYNGSNFTRISRQLLRDQNMSVGIGLVELIDPFHTMNCKPFFKRWILRTILHVLLHLHLRGKKSFVLKVNCILYFLIWFGVAFGVTVLKVLCFLCSFYKFIGDYGFISYNRFILLVISIKAAH